MKTVHVIMLTAFAAFVAAATPLFGQEGEMLRTMPHGTYQCALPGDAAGDAFTIVPDAQFRIGSASRYNSAQGGGTYLLRGVELVFTAGPRKGERYKRIGDNQVQRIRPDGSLEKLICTRLASR